MHEQAFFVQPAVRQLGSEKRKENARLSCLIFELNETELSQGTQVKGNPEDLKQSLSNILNNAAESMQGCGKVTLGVIQANHFVTVVVTDEGPGFTRVALEQFRRGVPVASSKTDGSGLGLRGSQECLRRLGGTLEISEVNGRASATIQIPILASPPSPTFLLPRPHRSS